MERLVASIQVRFVLLIKRLARLFGSHNPQVKFAILCTARSGSTWLHTLLNSHPNIHSQGEIVLENHRNNQFPFETFAFSNQGRMIKAVGMKVFYDNKVYAEALEKVLTDSNIKIILLHRESLLEQYVSLQLAQMHTEWSHSKHAKAKTQIELDLKAFEAYTEEQQSSLNQLQKKLLNHHVLEVSYEHMRPDLKTMSIGLQKFLGVRYFPLRSILPKQGSDRVSDHISNWNAAKEELIHMHKV